MNERTQSILIVISIVFGIAVAIIGMTGADWVGMFAGIGGIIVGGLWAVFGYLSGTRDRSAKTDAT